MGYFTSSYTDSNLQGYKYGNLTNATVLELVEITVPWWWDLAEMPHLLPQYNSAPVNRRR